MKFNFRKKPRLFEVGVNNQITIKDIGDITLEDNEQVTFNSESGTKYDFTKKIGVIMQHNLLIIGYLMKDLKQPWYVTILIEFILWLLKKNFLIYLKNTV